MQHVVVTMLIKTGVLEKGAVAKYLTAAIQGFEAKGLPNGELEPLRMLVEQVKGISL